MTRVLETVVSFIWFIPFAYGHGRLLEPPSRSSLWRFPNDKAIAPYINIVEPNYNDNGLFCGGFSHQVSLGGMCGICGDPYDAAVKDNEAGGKYAKGIIVRQYKSGSWIDVKVELTAHHKGYFEFRLCPWNIPTVPATQECFDQYVLDNGSPEVTKWLVPESGGYSSQLYEIQLKLPEDVECDQCILQWKYHTGNSWGCDEGGGCCIGCGPQEEFYGCADVAIGNNSIQPSQTISSTTTAKTTSTSTTTAQNIPGTTTTTTTSKSGTNVCQSYSSGMIMKDCFSFYMCSNMAAFEFACPSGTVFDEAESLCDHPYNVPPPCGTEGY